MRVIHTHLIAIADESLVQADVWASYLALESRGKYPIAGGRCRRERDALAAELPAGGLLAELLLGGRPIRVDAVVSGYRVEELGSDDRFF